jgi:hypothetical protein
LCEQQLRAVYAAAGAHYTGKFGKDCGAVWIQIENAIYERNVDRRLREGQALGVGMDEADILQGGFRRRLPCAFQHYGTEINTDNETEIPYSLRCNERVHTCTTAEVEQPRSLSEKCSPTILMDQRRSDMDHG